MNPMLFMALAQMAGKAYGSMNAQDDENNAKQLYLQQLQQIDNLKTPELERYAPTMAEKTTLGTIQNDPAVRASQMRALQSMENSGTQGGLTAEDKSTYLQTQNDALQQERGQRAAVMQNMAARGMSGSGSELASQLQAQQGAANRMNMGGVQAAGDSRQRALMAMSQAGQMSGQIRGQDYQQAADRAKAQDSINMFNTQNRNQMQMYNSQLGQQNYENTLRKLAMLERARGSMAGVYKGSANQTRDTSEGIGQGIGAVGGMFMNSGGS